MVSQTQPGTAGPMRYMQGVAVPQSSVNPREFFARTRRHTVTEKSGAINGLGLTDTIELKKADILDRLYLRVTGSIVVTPGTGSVNSTRKWPLDLPKAIRLTANGQSNILNANGAAFIAREFCASPDRDDRGVSQSIGGATVTQGTMSRASDSWGVGSGATAIAGGTYNFDIVWPIAVSENPLDLAGAIFCASSSTDLTLSIDWESQANLFVLAGNATVTTTINYQVTSVRYSIPLAGGQIVVPDLSVFHSFVKSTYGGLMNGANEIRLVGQGAGKTLLRVLFRTMNGNGTASAPLAMNAVNYGEQDLRFSANETPDSYLDGQTLRWINERLCNVDVGGQWGYGIHDFAGENAFRDTIDMGTTAELRLVSTIQSGVTLASPVFEYVQETLFVAGTGA